MSADCPAGGTGGSASLYFMVAAVTVTWAAEVTTRRELLPPNRGAENDSGGWNRRDERCRGEGSRGRRRRPGVRMRRPGAGRRDRGSGRRVGLGGAGRHHRGPGADPGLSLLHGHLLHRPAERVPRHQQRDLLGALHHDLGAPRGRSLLQRAGGATRLPGDGHAGRRPERVGNGRQFVQPLRGGALPHGRGHHRSGFLLQLPARGGHPRPLLRAAPRLRQRHVVHGHGAGPVHAALPGQLPARGAGLAGQLPGAGRRAAQQLRVRRRHAAAAGARAAPGPAADEPRAAAAGGGGRRREGERAGGTHVEPRGGVPHQTHGVRPAAPQRPLPRVRRRHHVDDAGLRGAAGVPGAVRHGPRHGPGPRRAAAVHPGPGEHRGAAAHRRALQRGVVQGAPRLRVRLGAAGQRAEQRHLLRGARLPRAAGLRGGLRALHERGGLADVHRAHGGGGHEPLPLGARPALHHGERHAARRAAAGRHPDRQDGSVLLRLHRLQRCRHLLRHLPHCGVLLAGHEGQEVVTAGSTVRAARTGEARRGLGSGLSVPHRSHRGRQRHGLGRRGGEHHRHLNTRAIPSCRSLGSDPTYQSEHTSAQQDGTIYCKNTADRISVIASHIYIYIYIYIH
ncbi:serine/arginine repetitive matrix protein 3 isoform X1 [Pseudoliparis swirei]|uniref:serine/arginine repetitive matrix protein 3 isoform X1 n=1 Tax=Pseudoliparis swirei TaxID=2059687 RepID=UPI0024BEA927|nr:serine/arginine repetitive matrix protein 3 isoform X1 [Pseudoliparis swirei]